MSPMEKRLARRIHNQRVRLRELEQFHYWQRMARVWSRSEWFDLAVAALKENQDLRDRLGMSDQFNQLDAMPEYTAHRKAVAADKLWKRDQH